MTISTNKPFPGIFARTYTFTQKIIPGGETVLSVFRCPSSELEPHSHSGPARQNGYATSDYKGCNGGDEVGMFFKVADGINYDGRKTGLRPQDVTDGLSNTIALGESAYYNVQGLVNEDWPIWLGGSGSDETAIFKTRPPSIMNCGIVPKSIQGFKGPPGPVDDDCAFSWHEGGAFFGFADGSVRFIDESIDMINYHRLGTKNDGEIITWQ
jgi:hypothetical protein